MFLFIFLVLLLLTLLLVFALLLYTDFIPQGGASGIIVHLAGATISCVAVSYVNDANVYETNQSYVFQITGSNVLGGISSTEYIIEDSTRKLECRTVLTVLDIASRSL